MTIQESIKALEGEYVKRILGAFTNTTVIAEAIHILLEFAKKQVLVASALPMEGNLNNAAQVDSNCMLGFYQVGELVAVYGRLVGLDFNTPEENIMQIACHPRVGVPSIGEVVVCRKDYFETLREKAKAATEAASRKKRVEMEDV